MPLIGDYAPSSSEWARDQAERYEASGGAEAGEMRGVPIVVLTSIGARSGKLRKTALIRIEHEGRYLAVASKGGAPEHPAWYHNLVADPRVELQDGPERWDGRARELTGDERATWWARALEVWPDYAAYQGRTERKIPLLLVERVETPHDA